MQFRVTNPEPTSMEVSLEIEKDSGAQPWTVAMKDSMGNPISAGVHLLLPPGGSFPARIIVTSTGGDSVGTVHVEGFLFMPGGQLVREMGGLAFTLHVRPPTAVDPHDVGHGPFTLDQSLPNPFSFAATIRYAIPRDGVVSLRIYDLAGRLVRRLVSGRQSAGRHEVTWRGDGPDGARLAAGLYFCQLEFQGRDRLTRKIMLLK